MMRWIKKKLVKMFDTLVKELLKAGQQVFIPNEAIIISLFFRNFTFHWSQTGQPQGENQHRKPAHVWAQFPSTSTWFSPFFLIVVSHLGDFTSFLPALFTSFLEDFGLKNFTEWWFFPWNGQGQRNLDGWAVWTFNSLPICRLHWGWGDFCLVQMRPVKLKTVLCGPSGRRCLALAGRSAGRRKIK